MNRFTWFFVFLIAFSGCTPRAEVAPENSIMLHERHGCVITVLLDLSGSFHAQMVEGGKAHRFFLAILDTYFKDHIGEKDEIVIAQISGADRALLWQGTPMQLRQDFANPQAFQKFLTGRVAPRQSKVLQNFAKAVEYMVSYQDVANGKTRSAIFVLSDMRDNDPDRDSARERLKKALETYASTGGVIGCYYVDQDLVNSCRNFLAKSGIRNFKVDADIVGNPQLPVID